MSQQPSGLPDRHTRREILAAGSLTALAGLAGWTDPVAFGSDTTRAPAEWAAVASQFLTERDLVCLNTGSLGTAPLPVLQAVDAAWRRLESDPVTLGYGAFLGEADAVRKKAGQLIGATVDEVAIVRNATDGMNLVAQGIDLHPGDRVLTTDQEHPGGARCWEHFAKRGVIKIDRVAVPVPPVSAGQIVDLFKAALTSETRVISVSHVTYTNGLVMPVAELAGLAREKGCLLVVDGAQAAGAIPVDVAALGCDAYAASGHKWLLGPKGTGILYIARRARERIAPMLLDDGYGVYTAITGFPNVPGILGLGAALDWGTLLGRPKMAARMLELRASLFEKLATLNGVKWASPPPGDAACSPLAGIVLPAAVKANEVADALVKKHRIVVRLIGGHGVDLRISTHVCNTEDHIDRLVAALRSILN